MTSPPTTERRFPAVTMSGLTKRYGDRVAVDRLTLDLPTGAVAGFIGPNGAGKTTTMAMLLGLVKPTSGTGTVLGRSLHDPGSYLGKVGALVDGPALWPALTGTENLEVLARLSGLDVGAIPDALALVGLAGRADDRFGRYSFGMKQRLGIAAALLGDPELLVLDEPTNGLDPAGINDMRQLIGEVAGGTRTVLVSSHILSELEQVCDWLIVIDGGSLVYQGPSQGFLGRAMAVVALAPERSRDLERLARLARAEGHQADRDGAELLVPVDAAGGADPRAVAVALNRAAIEEGIVLAELHVRRPTLETEYLALVEGARR